ncbi:MAG: desulfoferrodoxin family protein [Anaerovoracaceae bacterium]
MPQRFFKCHKCGNIYAVVEDSGCRVSCCGSPMEEIIPGAVDASEEKHVPVIEQDGQKVTIKVGSAVHPMTSEHYIEWISIETKEGNQRKVLEPESAPEASFVLTDDDELLAAYAYCNLHGLWKTER